ncbi:MULTISPECIES: hypothetical protein [unclassified Coleofasciculus]|uniref:hypothetical protein n=1 Tax=unclassified Coleofasciculus TaxID=2692782 RepID=UPI0018816F9A|nr:MULTISPECIES: hypothetical protein [unclassified Coleofasciculus]MBE9125322.1 hypothetical protein [Coleofasciculus sp. LEGE 07081]MBE9148526.1 hypothetical protein [Coleofasciculus sp. LEGE 07092]
MAVAQKIVLGERGTGLSDRLPPRPAVYVAEAKTTDEAREIHRRLWNLGNAPFLVILLPNEIRVYTGFDFSVENEKKGLVKRIEKIDSVLSRRATLAGLLHLTEILEQRFNGSIFSLPPNIREVTSINEIVALVASTFKGDDPASGQLHLDFEAYNFFYIPVETLSSIYEQFLREQGTGKEVGAVYTPEPVADYLRAISILLNSSVIQYFLFFNSSSWGVGRSKLYAKDLRQIALPELSSEQVKELAELGKRLAYLEKFTDTPDDSLQHLLDNVVEYILLIPKNIGIVAREFISIKLQLNKGKSVVPATASPSEEHLQNYGLYLRYELDYFTEGSGLRHKIKLIYSSNLIVCSVEFVQSDAPINVSIEKEQGDSSSFLTYIQEKTKQRFSQWVYVQRSLRIFEDSRVYICKSPRLIDWTRTQALNDSDDIIAEILSANRELHEVVR